MSHILEIGVSELGFLGVPRQVLSYLLSSWGPCWAALSLVMGR